MLGDSLLEAATRTYQPLDAAGAIETAQKIKSNESLLAQQQQATEAGAINLKTLEDDAPLKAALVKAQTKNSLLSNAIATSTDAATWDAHMRELSDEFPEAQQYVGRYTPVLQSKLLGVYGGQAAPVGAGASAASGEAGLEQPGGTGKGAAANQTANMDMQFAQTTPEQRAATLNALTKFTSALEKVGDEKSWDAMRQQLHAEGIPLMDQLGDYSPLKAASIYQRVQPIQTYLQNRSIADQAGIPAPKAAPDIRAVGGSIYSIDPYAGTANRIGGDDKFASAGPDMMGNPRVFNERTGKIGTASANDGVFGFDNFADRMIGQENGTGDRTAKNPNSSATGNGQFTEATWLQTVKNARPELADNMSDKQLLQLRKDPAFAKEMTVEYAQQNAQILQQGGQHVNATSLALAHRFGPSGAMAVLNAKPDAPLSSVLSADAIKANPGLDKETAGSYVKNLAGKVGLDPIGAPDASTDPNAVMDKIASAKSRDEAISYVPQQVRGTVASMLSGRQAPPSSFALKTPYWQNLMNMANAIDPNFDQTTWTARLNANKDMSSGGKSRTLLNSGETAIAHLSHLANQIPSVSGLALPFVGDTINSVVNKAEQPYTGGLNAYNDTLGHLGEETTKFYRGTGGSEADVERTLTNLAPNLSGAAKEEGVKNTVGLIYGRLLPMVDAYNKTMGTNYPPTHFVSPRTARLVKSMGFDPDTGEKLPAETQAGSGWVVKRVDKP